MAESFLRHSPLAHLGLAARATAPEAAGAPAPGVWMGERPFRGLVKLRGPAGDKGW